MGAIQELLAEHRLIWDVLDAMESPLRVVELRGKVPGHILEELMVFLEEYADTYHHDREERLLMGRLQQARLVEKGGVADLVLQEHEMARYRVKRMRELLPGALSGDADSVERYCQTLRSYMSLLRCHIGMEDRLFFPLAERSLSQTARAALDKDFEKMASEGGAELAARCERLGRQIIEDASNWAELQAVRG